MTLKCPRCGIDVSKEAVACCNCAYPAKKFSKIHYSSIEVCISRIDYLNDLCSVYDNEYRKLAEGRTGETLIFKCTEPKTVILEIFGCICKPYIKVLPGEKFRVKLEGIGKINIQKI